MVIFLSGNEPYLIDYNKMKYSESIIYKEMNIYQTDIFDNNCMSIARQFPLIDSKRVILLSLLDMSESSLLLEYLNDPILSTDLIITSCNVDQRSKLYRFLDAKKWIDKHNKLDASLLQKFVLNIFGKETATITKSGYTKLIDRLDYFNDSNCSLYTVKTYVNQLLYSSKVITEELIDQIVEKSLDENMFQLSNYLIKKENVSLFNLLDNLLLNKESPLAILGLLLRNFRLAYKVAINKNDIKKATSEIGVTTYQVGLYKQLSLPIINLCIDIIYEGMERIKSGANGVLIIRITVAKIVHKI